MYQVADTMKADSSRAPAPEVAAPPEDNVRASALSELKAVSKKLRIAEIKLKRQREPDPKLQARITRLMAERDALQASADHQEVTVVVEATEKGTEDSWAQDGSKSRGTQAVHHATAESALEESVTSEAASDSEAAAQQGAHRARPAEPTGQRKPAILEAAEEAAATETATGASLAESEPETAAVAPEHEADVAEAHVAELEAELASMAWLKGDRQLLQAKLRAPLSAPVERVAAARLLLTSCRLENGVMRVRGLRVVVELRLELEALEEERGRQKGAPKAWDTLDNELAGLFHEVEAMRGAQQQLLVEKAVAMEVHHKLVVLESMFGSTS
eukprot:TRINITY_DN9026_c0_g1_i2.p1 TRINITY_DN9026_c0_g1~~TRINITY_DN9026_c0_g1_i2.p1  ORF type:complete len:331 (+),score=108.04 TRINITY_DN9026_c0_g1_i2:54-1046(+)